MSHLWVPGKPQPKERPRMAGRRRVYTPEKTLNFEEHVRQCYMEQAGDWHEGLLEVYMEFGTEGTNVWVEPYTGTRSKLRGDVDNMIKSLLDGLQAPKGSMRGAYKNDSQVHYVQATKA